MKYQKQEIKGLGLISFTQARLILANETIFKLNGLNYLANGKKHNKETWLKFVSKIFGVKVENKTNRIEGYVLFDVFAAKKGWERCSVLSRKYPSLRHLLLGGKLTNQKTIDEYSSVFGVVPSTLLRENEGFINWLKSQISK